jgi:hypothetical protein
MNRENEIKANETIEEDKKVPEPSISSRLEELNEKIDLITSKNQKGSKQFKLTRKIRWKAKKAMRKKEVGVLLLRENLRADVVKQKIIDNKIFVDGAWRDASLGTIYLFEGKIPLIVLPEYGIYPIGNKEYLEAVEKGRIATPQKMTIEAVNRAEVKGKFDFGNINWKVILLLLALAGVAIWVMLGGQTV